MALFQLFSGNQTTMLSRSLSYSDFVERVDAGQVSKVTLDGEKIVVVGKDGNSYVTIKPPGDIVTDNLSRDLIAKGSRSRRRRRSSRASFRRSAFLPFLLLIGVWIFFMNRMQGGGRGGAMGFGKSKAKLLTEKSGKVTFNDVAGDRRGQGRA